MGVGRSGDDGAGQWILTWKRIPAENDDGRLRRERLRHFGMLLMGK